jgi:lipoyl-dependent peroxiredoxin
MNVLYTAEATATGGREGHVASSDGVLNLDLAVPKDLGGPGGAATNPEQLFAAGYAACFDNAMIRAARRMKLSTAGSRVTARVGIGVVEGGRFALSVELVVSLPEVEDDEQARALLDAAHQVCPYSNATRGNIDVQVTLVPPPDVD